MSSPAHTTVTPTTSTKRRFLGAARRKKTNSSVPFLQQFPTDVDNLNTIQSNEKQKQAKAADTCLPLPTNDSTLQLGVKKRTFEDDSSISQTENGEKLSVLITPVRRGANYRKGLLSQNDNSMQKCLEEESATPSFCLSSSQGEQATPVQCQRLQSRNSLAGSARKRFRHDFKSPMRNNQDSSPKPAEQPDMAKNVESLQQTLEELQTEISSLRNEGFSEDELQTHITKMHEYNELKDTGQMLLGKIAMIDGVTTKDLYERFGLELND